MSLVFHPENHEYVSTGDENIDWISVTSLISHFKGGFDAESQAEKSRKNKRSKWYGLTKEEVLAAWNKESKRATDLGTWYHNQREADICMHDSIVREGITVPIIKPNEEAGVKHAPSQKVEDGIYPEHLMYLKSAGICGQADRPEIVNGVVSIYDYKSNKEIKTRGFTNWEGITSMMKSPISHLEDCHLTHYALQLSFYMYMILKHNPKLKPGKLIIHHIIFEEAGRDKFDYPITALDPDGNPILKEIVPYELPYLKEEVITIINWLKSNRHQIKSKKSSYEKVN